MVFLVWSRRGVLVVHDEYFGQEGIGIKSNASEFFRRSYGRARINATNSKEWKSREQYFAGACITCWSARERTPSYQLTRSLDEDCQTTAEQLATTFMWDEGSINATTTHETVRTIP